MNVIYANFKYITSVRNFMLLDYKRKIISGSVCCTCLILRWQQLRHGGEQEDEEGRVN